MKQEIPKEVLEAFLNYEPGLPDHDAGEITVEAIGGGLINDSYKVSCRLKPDFFLQQLNKNVFTRPRDVQENYTRIWEYAAFEFTGLRLPSPKYCGKEQTLFVDEKKNYWRAFEFIDNTQVLSVAEKPAQAKSAATAFGQFTAAFQDFNISQLKEVIPGFHDLSARYRQFEKALEGEAYERMAKAIPVITELKQRERYKHFYEIITGSGEFPLRVMHHDAKIANVLFNDTNGKVICLVDFDTTMAGYFFSDLGDMIRSMACSEAENSTTAETMSIKKDYYEAIITGYLGVMGSHLTHAEKKYVHYSGLLMIYMQALRFITDYLDGDNYYRILYPEQNLDRAKNQLVLLQQLEAFLSSQYAVAL